MFSDIYTPYTPPCQAAVPPNKKIRVWYRGSRSAWDAHLKAAGRYESGARAQQLAGEVAQHEASITRLRGKPAPSVYETKTIDAAEWRLQQLREQLAAAREAAGWTEDPSDFRAWQSEAIAAALSNTVVMIDVGGGTGGKQKLWPDQLPEQVKLLDELPQVWVSEVLQGIARQQYDAEAVGKS